MSPLLRSLKKNDGRFDPLFQETINNFDKTTEESRLRWETNADCWDARMGDHSNHFHRNIIRPHTEDLKEFSFFHYKHPCFVRPEGRYLSSSVYEGEAIRGQPVLQYYFHRPLQEILRLAFVNGFVVDGFFEVPDDNDEHPAVAIIRLRKK